MTITTEISDTNTKVRSVLEYEIVKKINLFCKKLI